MKKSILIFITLTYLFALSNTVENFELVSDGDRIQLKFKLDEISLETVDDYSKIKSKSNSEISTVGMPKIPSYTSMLMLDPTKEYSVSYEVESSYVIDNVDIIPNQSIVNGFEKKTVDEVNLDFYNSELSFPNKNVTLSEPQIMRDLVVGNLEVIPFNYYPGERKLEVIDNIIVTVNVVGDTPDIRSRDLPKSKVFENIYSSKILNYNTNYRNTEYQQPAVLYIGSSSVLDNGTFEQLLDWRRERGYVVYTASTSVAGSSTTSIKNYIENAYDTFDPPPEYVTLIGDVGGSYSLPTYYEDFGHDSYGNQCEGDHPFSQLDGNDLLPEVILGRMSIRSSSEIPTVVYKILNYEKATYLSNYPDYYEKAAIAGDPSTSGNSCAITAEVIKEALVLHDFDDVDIKTSGNGWATWMDNELSDGALFFNYRGYLGMSGFSTGDVDNIANGWKLPFATILTCGTGSFAEDQTAMSEKFFRAGSVTNPRGGVAAIGTATWNTHTLFNNIVNLGIYNGLLSDDVETAGAALVSGKFALYSTYPGDPYGWISAFTQWNNLMGDAATHLWTDTPDVIQVNHFNNLSYGTNYLDIEVLDSSNNGVANAMVSLLRSNSIVADIYYTNDQGLLTVDLDPNDSNNMKLTVTKQDCKPYQSDISIDNASVNVNLNNSSDIIISDGNDNIPSAGETFDFSVSLTNFGSQTANNVSAILTSTSENVIVESSTVSYGNINSNSSAYGQNDFRISVLGSAVDSEDLKLRLEISDNQSNQWNTIVPIQIAGSFLQVVNPIYVSPGQTANVNIELVNTGSLSANNIVGELTYSGQYLEVNDAYGSWGALTSGQSENSSNGFNVSVSNDLIGGSHLILNLNIQDDQGYNRTELVTLISGTVSYTDPTGPDQYGYYIYDSGDNDYDSSPDYDWIEISGLGTNLNLSNSGDGNWSGNGPIADIDLPFDFKFYGIDYDEITVCTNGWIALGGSDAEAFRNYPIPSIGGPSPMIAAFWDDLETGNSGEVYYYSTNDYVIIQWDNMRTSWGNDNNTFQVILYNQSAPPYSDNNIKIQYQDFNNTSTGSFQTYPPIHGSFATIGIENHLADDGIQYSYYNNYPISALELSDQTALFITTQSPISLPAPFLDYTVNETVFDQEVGEIASAELIISNNGEAGSLLTYSITKEYEEVSSPFEVTGGGPDAFGYFWSDSDINNNINYDWIDISQDNQLIEFEGNDSSSELNDIGFDFEFYGNSFSQFFVNANGWIGFGEDNNEWYNGNIPSTDAPTNAIFGFWDDLNPVNNNCNPLCSGNVYYNNNSERLVVTFDNVAHWSSEGFEDSYYTFQVVIYSDGRIAININSITGNYSATVGIQNNSGTIASQVDVYDGDYFASEMSFNFIKPFIPSDWLTLDSSDGLTGEIYNGESSVVNITIDPSDLIIGQYLANILVSTNSMNMQTVPITLNVLEDSTFLGDINSDDVLNVSDIILLVNIVINNGLYNPVADLNGDNLVDVIDVVQLVNLILAGG